MIFYIIIVFVATTTALTVTPCTTNQGKITHPFECQLYFDCSRPGADYDGSFEPNLYECEYPNVFDSARQACGSFETVDCGNRKVVKDICETLEYRYAHAHGRPCQVDHLNCEGLADGKHGFPLMPNTPYYAVCYKERFYGKMECRDSNGQYTMFDSSAKECTGQDDN